MSWCFVFRHFLTCQDEQVSLFACARVWCMYNYSMHDRFMWNVYRISSAATLLGCSFIILSIIFWLYSVPGYSFIGPYTSPGSASLSHKIAIFIWESTCYRSLCFGPSESNYCMCIAKTLVQMFLLAPCTIQYAIELLYSVRSTLFPLLDFIFGPQHSCKCLRGCALPLPPGKVGTLRLTHFRTL